MGQDDNDKNNKNNNKNDKKEKTKDDGYYFANYDKEKNKNNNNGQQDNNNNNAVDGDDGNDNGEQQNEEQQQQQQGDDDVYVTDDRYYVDDDMAYDYTTHGYEKYIETSVNPGMIFSLLGSISVCFLLSFILPCWIALWQRRHVRTKKRIKKRALKAIDASQLVDDDDETCSTVSVEVENKKKFYFFSKEKDIDDDLKDDGYNLMDDDDDTSVPPRIGGGIFRWFQFPCGGSEMDVIVDDTDTTTTRTKRHKRQHHVQRSMIQTSKRLRTLFPRFGRKSFRKRNKESIQVVEEAEEDQSKKKNWLFPSSSFPSDVDVPEYDHWQDEFVLGSKITTTTTTPIFRKKKEKKVETKEVNDEQPKDTEKKEVSTTTTTSNEITIDLCYGQRPWYLFYCSRPFLHKLYKCATFDDEWRKIRRLAVPYTIQAIIESVFELADVAVIGHFFGTPALTAMYAIEFVLGFTCMLMEGSLSSLTTLCSQAIGAEQPKVAGQYVQIAVVFYQLLYIPLAIVWYHNFDTFLKWFDFHDEIADMAEEYGEIVLVTTFISIFDEALYYLLEVCGHETYSVIIELVSSILSFGTMLAWALLVEEPTLRQVGYIELIFQIVFFVINVIIIWYNGWFQDYWPGMIGQWAICDWHALRTFMGVMVPVSIGYIIEDAEWEILFFFAAVTGPAEVAAWGLLGTVWEAAEEIALATATAAEVRVARLLGAGCAERARYSSHKSLFIGVVLSLVTAIILLCVYPILPALLTKDYTLQNMFGELIPIVAVGVMALTVGSMSWNLLGAQGRYGLAAVIGGFGSWCVTLPLACISTLLFNFDLKGLTVCVVMGSAVSGAIMTFFLLKSNWEVLSVRVMKQNLAQHGHNETSGEYDEYDWKELPPEVQKAAELLGYTQKIWDNDWKPFTDDYDWKELTKNQQQAAIVLGYSEATWV